VCPLRGRAGPVCFCPPACRSRGQVQSNQRAGYSGLDLSGQRAAFELRGGDRSHRAAPPAARGSYRTSGGKRARRRYESRCAYGRGTRRLGRLLGIADALGPFQRPASPWPLRNSGQYFTAQQMRAQDSAGIDRQFGYLEADTLYWIRAWQLVPEEADLSRTQLCEGVRTGRPGRLRTAGAVRRTARRARRPAESAPTGRPVRVDSGCPLCRVPRGKGQPLARKPQTGFTTLRRAKPGRRTPEGPHVARLCR
jgi:hypothetical protein